MILALWSSFCCGGIAWLVAPSAVWASKLCFGATSWEERLRALVAAWCYWLITLGAALNIVCLIALEYPPPNPGELLFNTGLAGWFVLASLALIPGTGVPQLRNR